jgi:hypothetical protein
MWSSLISGATQMHFEVNWIVQSTLYWNYSFLMWFLLLSRATHMHFEVNTIVQRTPGKHDSFLVWSSLLSRTTRMHVEVNTIVESIPLKNSSFFMWLSLLSRATRIYFNVNWIVQWTLLNDILPSDRHTRMDCYRMNGWIPECQCELQRELRQSLVSHFELIEFYVLGLVLRSEGRHWYSSRDREIAEESVLFHFL